MPDLTALNGPVQLGVQAIALNGGAQTASGSSGRLLRITGSTASSTVNLPSAPTAGDLYLIDNQATALWTLAGNGANIDGASTKSVAAGSFLLVYGGSAWESVTLSQAFGDGRWAQLAGANVFSASVSLNGPAVLGKQAFTLNGGSQSVSATAGPFVYVSGSTASSTISLPSAATVGSGGVFVFSNPATVAWTLGSASGTIDGAATQTTVPGVGFGLISDGTNWRTFTLSTWLADSRYNQAGNNIAFAGNNTHAGSEAINAQLLLAKQTFAATGTVTDGGGSVVTFTGSTGSQTLSLPASPSTNRVFLIRNEASVTFTLSGNGINVDGSASQTVPIGGTGLIWYDGTVWWSLSASAWLSNTWQGTTTFGGTANFNSLVQIASRFTLSNQAASASTLTVGATGAPFVNSSYSPTGSQTITLPSAPTSNQVFWICDEGLAAGTNNIAIAGNGKNINGASSITLAKNGAAVQLRYNGTAWFIIGAYNYP